LIFMVLTILSGLGITIVITPYYQLKEQFANRCQEAGLDCDIWPKACNQWPRVTIVSAEAAVTDDFLY